MVTVANSITLNFRVVCDYMSDDIRYVISDKGWGKSFDEVGSFLLIFHFHFINIKPRWITGGIKIARITNVGTNQLTNQRKAERTIRCTN